MMIVTLLNVIALMAVLVLLFNPPGAVQHTAETNRLTSLVRDINKSSIDVGVTLGICQADSRTQAGSQAEAIARLTTDNASLKRRYEELRSAKRPAALPANDTAAIREVTRLARENAELKARLNLRTTPH